MPRFWCKSTILSFQPFSPHFAKFDISLSSLMYSLSSLLPLLYYFSPSSFFIQHHPSSFFIQHHLYFLFLLEISDLQNWRFGGLLRFVEISDLENWRFGGLLRLVEISDLENWRFGGLLSSDLENFRSWNLKVFFVLFCSFLTYIILSFYITT